ncbi:serine/threonine-protein kinase, partial [Rhodococcus indonesiensis]
MQVGALFGRYRLDRPLSVDATGEVWAAFDTTTGRNVAVRALPPDVTEDDEYRARFEREAEIAARIRNPRVLPIHDFGQIGSRLFLATPVVEGTDLQTMLRSTGSMDVPRAVDVVEQLASALEAVHAAGLVEQEVTSANVLVQGDGNVLLTDVGFPPHPGAATGVYGLTTVLYECLTGGLFQSSGGRAGPPQSSAISALPAGMVEVIARGTAPEPARRYGSASELAAAARAAASPSHPTGRSIPAVAPLARNRRVLIPVLAAIVAVLVLVVGGMALGAVSSDDADPAPVPIAVQPASPTTAPSPSPTTSTAEEQEPAPPREESQVAEVPSQDAEVPPQDAAPARPAPRSAPPAPAPAPVPAPAAPQVLPCYPGYEHTPPPDGPCLPAGSGPAPAPAPAPTPAAPQVLPCYPGYEHTPPPDG